MRAEGAPRMAGDVMQEFDRRYDNAAEKGPRRFCVDDQPVIGVYAIH